MAAASRARLTWFAVASCVGILYLVVGLVSASLANGAASHDVRFGWRLAAWLISGAIFVAQVGYERLRLRNAAASASFHSALAAGLGGFMLAVAATVHTSRAAGVDYRYGLALVVWPIVTALPAFIVALLLSVIVRPKPWNV